MQIIMFLVLTMVSPPLGTAYLAVVFGRAGYQLWKARRHPMRHVSAEQRERFTERLSEDRFNVTVRQPTVFAGQANRR